MKNLIKRFKKNEKGFTLIELLAVIVILAIIAAIAIPMINGLIDRTRNKADNSTATQIYEAARLFLTSENNGDLSNEFVPIIGSSVNTSTFAASSDAATAVNNTTNAGLVSKGFLTTGTVMPSSKAQITAGYVQFDNNGDLVTVVIRTGTTTATPKQWNYTRQQIMDGTAITPATAFTP